MNATFTHVLHVSCGCGCGCGCACVEAGLRARSLPYRRVRAPDSEAGSAGDALAMFRAHRDA